jgi:Domain of unknown function (DUF4279)
MALAPQFAESIKKVEVTFGFGNFSCDPAAITTALGIVPDETRRRGEQISTRGGRLHAAPFSTWSISSTSESKDVNDHCRELLKRLSGAPNRLDPQWGIPSFSVLYKATHLCAGNGPFFEVDVVRGIAALGAELWQDIYSLEETRPNEELQNS